MRFSAATVGIILPLLASSALALQATVGCNEIDEKKPPSDTFWRDPIPLNQDYNEPGMQGKGDLLTINFEQFEFRALTGVNSDALHIEATTGDPHSTKQFKVSFWAKTFSGTEVILQSWWISSNLRCSGKHSFNQDDLRKITVQERYYPSH